MIYLILNGRIGNQLFMYAAAEAMRRKDLGDKKIIINDYYVTEKKWENSLNDYLLENTTFTHRKKLIYTSKLIIPSIILQFYKLITRKMNFSEKYNFEKKYQKIFNFFGLIVCENGYIPYTIKRKHILMYGYFQSIKYFKDIAPYIKDLFIKKNILEKNIPIELSKTLSYLRQRNSICISIKVEHNIGSTLYDVCTKEYWKKSIAYMIETVKDPLFFICSDNLEYVKENIFDYTQLDYIEQPKNIKVSDSLAIMANCHHFIIGNTSFGWWAQYINKCSNKIVIAPKRWMNCDMPIDFYMDNWILM